MTGLNSRAFCTCGDLAGFGIGGCTLCREGHGARLHQGAPGVGEPGVDRRLGRHDLEDELRPLAVLGARDRRLLHDHGAGDVDDDASLAGGGEAAAERLDEADRPSLRAAAAAAA